MDNIMTFFSGTDTATLREEGNDRNHFVSLIVNNAGSYTAAITRKVKSKRDVHETFSYESFDGVLVEATDTWIEEIEELQYFYLDITKEGADYSFPDVDTRLEEIKKTKEAKAPKTYSSVPSYTPSGNYGKGWKMPKKPKVEIPVSQQPTLPFDATEIESEPPFNHTEVVPDQEVSADPKLIRSLCMQLLTGSAMIPNDSKIDIKKWVINMQSVVEKRFGKGKEGLENYKSFVEIMVEFLVWNTEDPTLVNLVDSDYMATVIAEDMVTFLSGLPQNKYNEICQNALLNYM